MLNYAFDPTIVNPVSARLPQGSPQVMGGLRFAGVDGAPDRPGSRQEQLSVPRRHGVSDNDKTVFRAGYGKYFLNPTSQSNNNGFGLATPIITSNDGNRTPTYALGNPWPNGIQAPPGSSLGALTFLGRGPSTSNPDFIVPNVHQFSVGIQRELPWRLSLEATYAGSRSYDIEGNFGGYNEPSAAFQAQCDVTLGGSRSLCDQLLPNPFFRCRRLREHDPVHEHDALGLRAGAAVPGVHRLQPEPAEPREDVVRLGAVRVEQALGQGRHHQHQLHVGAALDRGWREYHDGHQRRLRR